MNKCFVTASSPWLQGTIVWADRRSINNSDLLHWARYPLWLDCFPESSMLPIASWQNLPEMLKLKLPTQYHLCDKTVPQAPESDDRVCVCDRGLTISGKLLFRWSAVKHDWPALVANASQVTSNRFSALKAMRIWLGIEEIDTYAPIYIPPGYIPPGVNIDVEDCSFDLSDRLDPQELRSASVKIINDFYQHRQANVPWRSRFMRKMRKLRRDPKQFWRDSKPYKRFVK